MTSDLIRAVQFYRYNLVLNLLNLPVSLTGPSPHRVACCHIRPSKMIVCISGNLTKDRYLLFYLLLPRKCRLGKFWEENHWILFNRSSELQLSPISNKIVNHRKTQIKLSFAFGSRLGCMFTESKSWVEKRKTQKTNKKITLESIVGFSDYLSRK